MFTVTVRDHMMVSHRFRGEVFGPAQRLHGATYVVDAAFSGPELGPDGILLDIGAATELLREVLGEVPVIALHIPKFTDGRCYTHARRIRHHWGYEGDVLVYGDVLRDQLVYLWRVGVNAFHMRQDQDLHASLGAFRLYSAFYQYGPLGSHAPRGERAA